MREQIYDYLRRDMSRDVIIGDEACVTAGQILRVAQWIKDLAEERKLPKDYVFVLVCHTRRDTILLKLACYLNDFSFAALDGDVPPQKLTSVCRILGASLILSDVASTRDESSDVERTFPTPGLRDIGPEWQLRSEPSSETSKYVVFTSGSTGDPKAVPIAFWKLEKLIGSFAADYTIGPQDRWAQFSSSGFDLSIMDVFAPVSAGAAVVTLDRWLDRLHPYEAIARHGITVWHSTPTALRHAPRKADFSAPSIRLMLFCGEPLTERVLHICAKHFPNAQVFNHYGPAEATIYCTRQDVTGWRAGHDPIPIGREIADWHVYTHSTQRDAPSEIIIESQFIADGYLNTNSSAFSLVPGAAEGTIRYASGDFGWHEAGVLFYASRADDQVKIDGHRIELLEVNNVFSRLCECPCVTLHVDGQLHLFVEGPPRDATQLRKTAGQWLVAAKLPEIHFLDQLPRNTNDKVDRKQLSQGLRQVST